MGLQATNAGIDFQQRVSAYMMILMEFTVAVLKRICDRWMAQNAITILDKIPYTTQQIFEAHL